MQPLRGTFKAQGSFGAAVFRARTAQNVAINVALRWLNQLLGVATKIVLIRLLFPNDFGVYALASGLIGFVGLVVPHVVRLLTGPNARSVLPISAIWGANLLVFADLAARLAGDIPVGVVTAVIGAPFFLALLRRARTGYEL